MACIKPQKKKNGTDYAIRTQQAMARNALLNKTNVIPLGKNIACHKCKNDSMAHNGFVCQNPDHLYWGDYKDNAADRGKEMNVWLASNAGKHTAGISSRWSDTDKQDKHLSVARSNIDRDKQKAAARKARNAYNAQVWECEYCGKQGQHGAMKRWHGKNCKHKTSEDKDLRRIK